MDTEDELRMCKCSSKIIDALDVREVVPFLIEKGKLSTDDSERIQAEVTTRDKADRLLRILFTKENSYGPFRESLKRDYSFLVEELDNVLIQEDEIEQNNKDEETFITEFLRKSYTEDDRSDIFLYEKDIRNDLKTECEIHGKRQKKIRWGKVAKLLKVVFEGLKEEKSKKKGIKYCFIRRKQEESDDEETQSNTTDTASANTSNESSILQTRNVSELTAVELSDFLNAHCKDKVIDSEILETFVSQEVSGEWFLTLTIEDTKDLFPGFTFGKRKSILKIKDAIKQEEIDLRKEGKTFPYLEARKLNPPAITIGENSSDANESFRESFRTFDKPSSQNLYYRKHAILSTSHTMPSDLLQPVHRFVYDPVIGKDGLPKLISEESSTFIAACLNDRTNGTIHFGIQKEPTHGKIIGIACNRRATIKHFYKTLHDMFFEEDFEIVCRCVRPPQFIEISDKHTSEKHFVVEIDVIASYDIVQDNAFFLKSTHKHPSGHVMRLVRFHEEEIIELKGKHLLNYMNRKGEYSEQRRNKEKLLHLSHERKDLRQKFLDLYAAGNNTLTDDVYPLLFLGPIDSDMNAQYISQSLDFITDLEPRAIFDFDSHCNGNGLYKYFTEEQEQIHRVVTTEEFDKYSKIYESKPDGYKNFLEDLSTTVHMPWIFCNGYDLLSTKSETTLQWKQERAEGFKESLRYYSEELPKGRVVALFLLFSKENDIILEAADEAFVKFKDQWIVMAESVSVAGGWTDQLIKRQSTDRRTMKERSIFGIPWNHVNHMVKSVMGYYNTRAKEISTSTGVPCILKERVRNELSDLDVLCTNECDKIDVTEEGKTLEDKRRAVREVFFRGGKVTWWNFWFRDDHVLLRDKHEPLMKIIRKALEGKTCSDDQKVAIVNLFHQPGAGGTTSAKQVLWCLKENYRCCVVKQITDQTVEQIAKLRTFEDQEQPLPPILLIDNGDEERIHNLYVHLEERARTISRRSEHTFDVFCLLLVCSRRVNLPHQIDHNSVVLKHDLSDSELEWFKRKGDFLNQQYQADKGINPKLLISFNILKENFNTDYIKRTVAEFVDGIDIENEKRLLRYLSMIHAYDLDFQPIPVSAFDALMESNKVKTFSFGSVSRDIKKRARPNLWDAHLSQSVLVLLNRTARTGSHLTGLAIISTLFATEIFTHIQRISNTTTSGIMLEFLGSNIFHTCARNSSVEHLTKIVRDILKKRDVDDKGMKKKFSPMVLDILEKEGIDCAQKVFEAVFHITPSDAMFAQQISRLFIHSKNWTKAEQYAFTATDMKPDNSFLWDTFGQIFLSRLSNIYVRCTGEQSYISQEEAEDAIRLALRGMKMFRKEQDVSENERYIRTNDAGYYAELQIVNILLDVLRFWPPLADKATVHKFLVSSTFMTKELKTLDSELTKELKQMHERVEILIRIVDEKNSQLKSDFSTDVFLNNSKTTAIMTKYVKLRISLDDYFAEETNEVPLHLSPNDQADFKRGCVQKMGGRTLHGIIKVARSQGNTDLLKMFTLLKENVESEFCIAYDLLTLVGVSLFMHRNGDDRVHYSDILQWSKRLFQITMSGFEDRSSCTRPFLEAFLYPIMLHWPTESRKVYRDKMCTLQQIQEALRRLKIDFQKNHPRQRVELGPYRKRDTTYFFLGNGKDFEQIVYYEDLDERHGPKFIKGDNIWERPSVRGRLLRTKGTLLREGFEIQAHISTHLGNVESLTIPTALPVEQRYLWQREVYFFIGFGWSGPKAYDVSLDGPTESTNITVAIPKRQQSNKPRNRRDHLDDDTHDSFQMKINNLDKNIRDIDTRLKRKLASKKYHELSDERKRLVSEKELLIERRLSPIDM